MYVTNVEQVWGNHLAHGAMEWYPRSALGYLQHACHYNVKDPPACHCCWSQCVEYSSSCQFLPSSQSSLSRSWTWMRAVKSKARLPGVKLSWEGQGSTAFSRLTPVHSQREAWTLLNWSACCSWAVRLLTLRAPAVMRLCSAVREPSPLDWLPCPQWLPKTSGGEEADAASPLGLKTRTFSCCCGWSPEPFASFPHSNWTSWGSQQGRPK